MSTAPGGGIYATYFNSCFYINGGIYGGYNSYDSSRRGLQGNANGNSNGAEFSTFVSGGYDIHLGYLTVGPIVSLQYTNVYLDGFREKGSLAPLSIHSDSEESLAAMSASEPLTNGRLDRSRSSHFLKRLGNMSSSIQRFRLRLDLPMFLVHRRPFLGRPKATTVRLWMPGSQCHGQKAFRPMSATMAYLGVTDTIPTV
jgi:hypothetical protein